MENDLIQLWRLVAELSDQLAHNRAITASLQAQAGSVKVGSHLPFCCSAYCLCFGRVRHLTKGRVSRCEGMSLLYSGYLGLKAVMQI